MAITAAFSLLAMPSVVVVKNDAVTTLSNLLQHEVLVRCVIVSHLASHGLFILLATTFYRLFKGVHDWSGRLLVVFVVAQVPLVFMGEVFNYAALMIAKGNLLPSVQGAQNLALKADAVMFLLKLRSYSLLTAQVFWGLWLIPLGRLAFASGFMPRVLGILLILAGIAYLLQTSTDILVAEPNANAFVSALDKVYGAVQSIAEIAMILWLVSIGTLEKSTSSQVSEA